MSGGVYIGLSYYQSLLLLMLILAALADLKTDRIPNGFIVVGITIGLAGSHSFGPGLSHSVISVFLAFLLLYPLFKIGTLGAGDIKVVMMTGVFFTAKEFLIVLAASFAAGAVLSVMKLMTERNAKERLVYLLSYVSEVVGSRQWKLYGEDLNNDYEAYRRNKIHFTIPVLLGVTLRMGGLI